MSNKNTTNDGYYRYYPIVVGDILLHSERKSTPIQVISQPLTIESAETIDQLNISRVLPNSSGITNDQTRIVCDLKNPTIDPSIHERALSAGKFIHIHQAGWAFVKEFKSKVLTINNKSSKSSRSNTNSNNKQTHF